VRREGTDLHMDLPITVPEAVLGAEVRVPTFDGEK
jgi:DnaJ-class molecular chaperone